MKSTIHFLAPVPSAFPSGGNIYNEGLIQALIGKGYALTIGEDLNNEADLIFVDSIFYPEKMNPLPETKQAYFLAHVLPEIIPDPTVWAGAIVTGRSTQDGLLKAGWPNEKVLLLEPASDPVISIPQRRNAPLSVAWVSNLVPNKNILPFLRVLEPGMPFKIRLAGSAEMDLAYANDCKAEIIRLKGVVDYLGPQNRFQIKQLLKKSNLFLSTSEFESFGMAIQEARLYALPILAFAKGTGEHGALSLEGFSSFSEIINRLLELNADSTQMQKMLDLAWLDRKEYAEQVPSWEQQARKLIHFLF